MNKKLHILFLSSWYPSRVFPTNGDFVQRHAEAIASKHTVTLVHVVTDKNLKGSTEIVHKKINNVKTIIAYVPEKKSVFKFFTFLKTYLKIFKAIDDFDVVHLNVTYPKGLIALYLKILKRKPYIITEHWTGYQYPLNKSIGFLKKVLTKLIVKNANFVCPVSDNLASEMKGFGLNGKYKIVPNVVDTHLFLPKKNKSKTFKILHVSNMLDIQKNVSGIIRTLSDLQNKISNFELVLVGENSLRYEDLTNSLNLKNITFIDHISQNDLVEYFHQADLFILFSNYENLPCVILESFSTGTPVITTNVGGISEFFPENFGAIISKNNTEELEHEIMNFYNSKKEYESPVEMHTYAKNNFSQIAICEMFTDLYLKTIE